MKWITRGLLLLVPTTLIYGIAVRDYRAFWIDVVLVISWSVAASSLEKRDKKVVPFKPKVLGE